MMAEIAFSATEEMVPDPPDPAVAVQAYPLALLPWFVGVPDTAAKVSPLAVGVARVFALSGDIPNTTIKSPVSHVSDPVVLVVPLVKDVHGLAAMSVGSAITEPRPGVGCFARCPPTHALSRDPLPSGGA